MAKPSKGSEAAKTVKLGRDLRIAGAAAALASLRAAAQGAGTSVALDARQVEKADAGGLQALLAGRRFLLESGKTVTWTGTSEPLRAAAEQLDLAAPLGIGQ